MDRGIRNELQWANDEDEHLHDVSVAAEHIGERVRHLGLDLIPIEPSGSGSSQFDEDERERSEREDEEQEENVVAVEIVIGLCRGVIEPRSLEPRQVSSDRDGSFLDRGVRDHRFPKRWLLRVSPAICLCGDLKILAWERDRERRDEKRSEESVCLLRSWRIFWTEDVVAPV